MGVQLFTRSNQGVTPTKVATGLSGRINTILNDFTALQNKAKRAKQNRPPRIRVGVIPLVLFSHLTQISQAFAAEQGASMFIKRKEPHNNSLRAF